jgi:hypothetical protein
MCKAFSCLVDIDAKRVTWKLGVDSHSNLVALGGYKDDTADPRQMLFAKIEITPKNGDYLNPDEWVYRVDESSAPMWIGREHEAACRKAHTRWLRQLDKFIIRHPMIDPFKLKASEVGPKQIALLKKWASVWDSGVDSVWASVRDSVGASVRDSVRASVWDSVWDSVGASVWASVRDSVWASVRASVWASVWASVRAYTGSFFKIPVWKYIKHPKGKYPYQPLVALWNQGFVPSFDGTTWRLHAGPKAKIVYSIKAEELKTEKV